MENLFDLYGKKSYTFVIIMDESKLYKKGDDTVLHYYFDPTYILVIIGIIISMAASANVNGSFRKYSRVLARRGVRAEQAAETILRNAGIYDVTIQHVSGNLTDHYDPRSKTLRLSDSVYGSSSVSAIGVAAHECGHAIQHDSGYVKAPRRSRACRQFCIQNFYANDPAWINFRLCGNCTDWRNFIRGGTHLPACDASCGI